MDHGKPPWNVENAPFDRNVPEAALTPLSWEDLTARLPVAPRVPDPAPEAREAQTGSFNAALARHIAPHHSGKRAVNHDASANSKEVPCKVHRIEIAAPRAEEIND